jgi:cytochrome c-type biogenesis protein CcmH
MAGFVAAALALVAVTLLLLLRPWRRRQGREAASATAHEVNAALYRTQLAELERDIASGTLAPADERQARLELQRRLLEDTAAPDDAHATPAGMRRTTVALALAVPLLAAGLYAWLGTPAALQPQATTREAAAAGEMERMIATLAARLEAQPDNPAGWAMLARSYRAMGRIDEAARAFERIGDPLLQDPMLLASYADVLAMRAGGNPQGKPLELAQRALTLDPAQPLALAIVANAAHRRKDFALAVPAWERLLAVLPQGSEDAQWVEQRLAEAHAQGAAGPAPASAPGAVATPPKVAIATAAPTPGTPAAASVRGRVSLSAALAAKALPTDTVFVYALLPEGSRMPLAVIRARVADLPLEFVLDDSLALNPQHKLSGAAQVRIEARVSRSGDAMPAAGDLLGTSGVVRPGDSAPVALQIDRVRP